MRLVLEYPREWEALIDEVTLREHASRAFEFHLIKRPMIEARARLAADETIGSLTPLELLERYWRAGHVDASERETLHKLAQEIIEEPEDLS